MDGEKKKKVLVVEDEINLAEVLRENLLAEGYDVEVAPDGLTGLERMRKGGPDLVVLDVMMPGLDGFSVCEKARAEGLDVPILFLTAKGNPESRIRGLEAGCDDYLPKPFRLKEFLLRVKAVLRRARGGRHPGPGAHLEFAGNEVDFATFKARSWDGREHQLCREEAMILKCLADREGEVVLREEILESVWGTDLYPSTRVIEEWIVSLRKRLEPDPENPGHILTVPGAGYLFEKKEREEP